MQNVYNNHFCYNCKKPFLLYKGCLPYIDEYNHTICDNCHKKQSHQIKSHVNASTQYNEPEHYHKHDMDTIEFLQKGFPPEVCMGFFLGSLIKYAQRATYKNGREDYVKMVDYSKRALAWYDELNK